MKLSKFLLPVITCFSVMPAITMAGVRDDVGALQIGQQEIEQRMQRIESQLNNQGILQMLKQVQQMSIELQELRGQVESQSNELASIRKRQRDLYLDIDRRLSDMQLESDGVPAASIPPAPSNVFNQNESQTSEVTSSSPTQPPVTATVTPATTADSESERNAYKAAFEILREGRYPEAIEAFSAFLQKYPNGSYTDNAQYWLGEAHYVSRNFDVALSEFQKVLDRFPRSRKVADAKLKMGYTYYELQQWGQAKQTLNSLLASHPNTSVAPLAEKRLLRMASEGR